MHFCMFLSPVDASLWWYEIFGSALSSVALLGVGRRGGFSSHIFPDVSITVGYPPSFGLFIFARCVYNTLEFRKSLEDSSTFLRVPLLIFDVQRFTEEALKSPANFWPFPSELACLYRPISSVPPILLPGFRSSNRWSGGVSEVSCLSLSYQISWGVSKVLIRTDLSRKWCPSKYSP